MHGLWSDRVRKDCSLQVDKEESSRGVLVTIIMMNPNADFGFLPFRSERLDVIPCSDIGHPIRTHYKTV